MNYATPFGPPPPSPVSRFATAATSPGPVQDLSSYMNSAANTSADGLGYTATSPQPTGFGHAMAVRHSKQFFLEKTPTMISFISIENYQNNNVQKVFNNNLL